MNTANSGPAKPEPTSVVGVVKPSTASPRPVFLAYATGGLNVLASSNQDPTHRFHAFQSVFYLLAALAAHALLSVLDVLSPFRPIFDLAAAGAYGYQLWLAQFFPQISLTGSGGGSFGRSSTFSSLMSTQLGFWSYGAQVTQPIYTGGALRGNLHLAESQHQQALLA